MNEPLRQALIRARLRETDVAAHLGVDPKTVRRWINGRVPYPENRAALAELVDGEEADLWPEAAGPLTAQNRLEELVAVYPHRWAIPREVWRHLFESAKHEIDILAYSALWLAEDAGLLGIIADKASRGAHVRIAMGDPDCAAVTQRGQEEGIDNAMSAKVRNAIALTAPLMSSANVDLHVHDTVLYNSIYRADDQLFANQHIYGIPAAQAPVLHLQDCGAPGDMTAAHRDCFQRIWNSSTPAKIKVFTNQEQDQHLQHHPL